jgi:hypothetical protein
LSVKLRRHDPSSREAGNLVARVRDDVSDVLQSLARRLGSPALAQLAGTLANGQIAGQTLAGDHFVKVRELIKDLVARLEQDAVDEATAKSLCDKQMQAGIGERDSKQTQIESLEASLEVARATVKGLSAEILSLDEEIAAQHKALNEMTELRKEERGENNKTISEATTGAEEVKQAIQILTDFYGAQGALLQQKPSGNVTGADRFGNTIGDLAPDAFEGEYQGKQQASKGILGLLEIIASDFDRTVAATTTREEAAEAEFQKQSVLINDEINTKSASKTDKESARTLKEAEIVDMDDDLRSATTLHAQALESLEKLQASCVNSEESWEERKAQREKEIEALKQALKILEEWKG